MFSLPKVGREVILCLSKLKVFNMRLTYIVYTEYLGF